VHKLLARQLAKATKSSGELDLQALLALVAEAYEQSNKDRQRTDRSISLMIREVEQLNRGLDRLVQERTATLREREAELQAQNLWFDAALENMPHGLTMFDRDERLAVSNTSYREMYGLSLEQTKPGRTLITSSSRKWRRRTFRSTLQFTLSSGSRWSGRVVPIMPRLSCPMDVSSASVTDRCRMADGSRSTRISRRRSGPNRKSLTWLVTTT
jgi:PAS domain-containing protein